MQKIMIIRHGEKHQHGIHDRGITQDGRRAHHELTVKGWQRAAALVHLFAPPTPLVLGNPIQTPRAIFASDATRDSPSLRAQHTAKPLAEALGMDINHDYAEGEEAQLATALASAPSPVLVVWHHNHIGPLVKEIAGARVKYPARWPDDRFDVVWLLDRDDSHGAWRFSQVAQRLLPGDGTDIF